MPSLKSKEGWFDPNGSPKNTWSSSAPMPEEFTDWATPVVVAWLIRCWSVVFEGDCNGSAMVIVPLCGCCDCLIIAVANKS